MAVTRINQHFPLSTELFLKAKTLLELLNIACETKARPGNDITIYEDIMVRFK